MKQENKPEPLKGKGLEYAKDLPFYWESDIRSAVEWLKDSLSQFFCDDMQKGINGLIDVAFEDVMKNE